MTEKQAIKETAIVIRVVAGLSALHRDRIINAGASVHYEKATGDDIVIGMSLIKFEEITGMKVSK